MSVDPTPSRERGIKKKISTNDGKVLYWMFYSVEKKVFFPENILHQFNMKAAPASSNAETQAFSSSRTFLVIGNFKLL